MSVCKIEEGDAGRSVPRTCPTCKLSGTCHKGLDRKSQAAEIARLRAALDAMTVERDAARTKALEIANDEAARADGEGPESLAAQVSALRIAAAIRAMKEPQP